MHFLGVTIAKTLSVATVRLTVEVDLDLDQERNNGHLKNAALPHTHTIVIVND